jgi:hypothetical protein
MKLTEMDLTVFIGADKKDTTGYNVGTMYEQR